ncbi:hypothetical protein V491_00522 [Pseudogymnoascus sp. VKM F-3775]|nr:hypothetical protein V491_00522 [Pseudogymnoascus sp. VKM F-3775]
MSDASTTQTPVRQRSMPTGSNAEGMGGGNDELDDTEAGGRSNRKRQRRHPKAPATHQCGICQRTYERADRLSRHLMAHENARRFQCQRCQKSFNRADLLTRHMMTHSRNDDGSGLDHGTINRADRMPGTRTSQSRPHDTLNQGINLAAMRPLPSRQQHLQSRPQRRRLEQQYQQQGEVEGEGEDEGEDEDEDEEEDEHEGEEDQDEENYQERQEQLQKNCVNNAFAIELEQQPTGLILEANQSSNPRASHLPRHDGTTDHELAPPAWVETAANQVENYNTHSMSVDDNQLVFDSIMDEIMPYIADFNNQNLDTDLLNFTFQDTQLDQFLAPPIGNVNNDPVSDETSGQSPRLARDVRAGYAAFKRSPWLWTPQQLDRTLQDGENLTLDEGSISALTPNSPGLTPDIPNCGFPTISPGTRDKMFYLVATMDKYTNRVIDFPSVNVINHVVEAFFIRHNYQVDNWIHIPSVSLFEFIPELGLAMVVAGSAVIAVPAIWKMGLVLQDVIRVKLGELWERQNSATRNLQPLQAWMLSLDAGLWSGFQRQMELAESFVQTLITMMRRGGMFGVTADAQSLIPHESDTGQVLEAKWKKWIQRESFKRLSIHLFLHDTRASIALQKNPLISVTEITISLPASRIFYVAGSATEWKACFNEQGVPALARASLQLIDVMHDMSVIDDLYSEIDVSLCYMAAIHGFWGQIWAFRESWKFYNVDVDNDSVHRLWLMTQQRELYQQVKAFEQALAAKPVSQSELLIVVELLLMILHVSTEELQRFAGKYGEEAASKAFVSLDRWSVTEQARKGVWHAGQVLRWAAVIPPTELRDLYAIAVYFASLALWAFGHLSTSKVSPNGSVNQSKPASLDSNDKSAFIVLNGEETSSARSFIAGRQITPALRTVVSNRHSKSLGTQDATFIQLDDPNAVLEMARDLYRNNFPFGSEPLPPLVENIGNLMRDLGGLPQNRFSRDLLEITEDRENNLIFEKSVSVPLKASSLPVRCNVYRPLSQSADEKFPVLVTYGPFFAKSFSEVNPEHKSKYSAWETPDPVFWTSKGYVVVRCDERGLGQSPGLLDTMSRGTSECFFDVIEWAAEQPWSSGKVGLLGISYYAGGQWRVAARRPKGLAAIVPWEGMTDYYRDRCRHGGILSDGFIKFWWNRQIVTNQYGKPGRAASKWGEDTVEGDLPADVLVQNRNDQNIDNEKNKFLDDTYYASKDFNLEDIEVPVLSVANWGGILLHLRGNVNGYMWAGSKLKYLRFITGRHDLPFYYKEEVEVQKSFLDAFLKDEDTVGWSTPGKVAPVSMILRKGNVGFNNAEAEKVYERREEQQWPLEGTQYTKFYLTPENTLSTTVPSLSASIISYEALGNLSNPQLVQFISAPFEADTEVTGHITAHLNVSLTPDSAATAPSKDIDIFVTLRYIDPLGKEVHYTGTAGDPIPLAKGWLRTSLRKVATDHPHHREYQPYREYRSIDVQEVKPDIYYAVDVEVWPTNVIAEKGGRIVFEIASGDTQGSGIFTHTNEKDRSKEVFSGTNNLHFGEGIDNYIVLPIVPKR